MNRRLRSLLRKPATRRLVILVSLATLAVAVAGIARQLPPEALRESWLAIRSSPFPLLFVMAVYGCSFAARARLWSRVLPEVSFGHALAGIHLTLAANHLLPLKLGETLRVTSVVRRRKASPSAATASTALLRAADLAGLLIVLITLGPSLVTGKVGPALALFGAGLLAAAIGALAWVRRLRTRGTVLRLPGAGTVVGATLAWVLEACVVWQATRWAGIPIGYKEAILVTCVAVLSQVLAVTPGGYGTYEAAAAGALVALGAPAGPGVAAALVTHVVKTVYSLLAGGVAMFIPSPGLAGRLRLPRRVPRRTPVPGRTARGSGVLLFLPARDEEVSIAGVIGRLPSEVCGEPVRCLIVDDGSTDRTAGLARDAGAEVIRLPGLGLGAGVRAGLAHAVANGYAAVAFCDADGEYDPAELEVLVGPILEGRADYVIGSRFAGGTRRMRWNRNFGNRLLSAILSVAARRRISDGQSGFRALSLEAAEAAEVIHDYNYAQVLTLDLLGKGFSYAEVPIDYRHRTHGRSFVKLIPYLRAVVPAVYRELNSVAAPAREELPVSEDVEPVAAWV